MLTRARQLVARGLVEVAIRLHELADRLDPEVDFVETEDEVDDDSAPTGPVVKMGPVAREMLQGTIGFFQEVKKPEPEAVLSGSIQDRLKGIAK